MSDKVSISLDRRQWAIVCAALASIDQNARAAAVFKAASVPFPTDAEMLNIGKEMKRQTDHLPSATPSRPCPECSGPTKQDHNSFWCDQCRMLWALPEQIKPA